MMLFLNFRSIYRRVRIKVRGRVRVKIRVRVMVRIWVTCGAIHQLKVLKFEQYLPPQMISGWPQFGKKKFKDFSRTFQGP